MKSEDEPTYGAKGYVKGLTFGFPKYGPLEEGRAVPLNSREKDFTPSSSAFECALCRKPVEAFRVEDAPYEYAKRFYFRCHGREETETVSLLAMSLANGMPINPLRFLQDEALLSRGSKDADKPAPKQKKVVVVQVSQTRVITLEDKE